MRINIAKVLAALVLLIFAFNFMPDANAQSSAVKVEQGDLKLEGEDETQAPRESAISDSLQEEEPPPPEAPYPGAAEEGFTAQDSTADSSPAPQGQTIKLEPPIQRAGDGTYYYGVEETRKTSAFTFRGGVFGAPAIQNPRNNVFFRDIYEQQDYPTAFFEYEMAFKTPLGSLGGKVGSGVFFATGKGRFADPNRQFDEVPEEYTFIMFPNTIGANYRLRFHEKQPIVPYAEGGLGYFTFGEIRDDGDNKFAGAAVTYLTGGVALLLDWLDPKAVRDLDREYGINHVWLTAEYREIVGLDNTYDFSSRVISGGIMMEF